MAKQRTHKNYEVRVKNQLKKIEVALDDIWNKPGFESRVEFIQGFQMALECAHLGFPVEALAKDAHEAGVQFGRTWLLTARCAKNCPKCKGKGEYLGKKYRSWEKRQMAYCPFCRAEGFEGAQSISDGIVQNIQIIESEANA